MAHRLNVGGALLLYGDVGDLWGDGSGFKATDVVAALAEIGPGPVTVRLNSGGGYVSDGVAIFNALKQHRGEIEMHVDAMAASAASVIAMAGDRIIMHEGAFMMIHDPAGVTVGTAADHNETAAVLDKMGDVMAGIYANKTGHSVEEIRSLMLAETWFDAEEAVAFGFATESDARLDAVASAFDYSIYARTPATVMQGPQKMRAPVVPVATATQPKELAEMSKTETVAATDTKAEIKTDDTRAIMRMGVNAKLSLAEVDAIVTASGGNLDKAKDMIIDKLADRDPSPAAVLPTVEVTADGRDRFLAGVEKALLGKARMEGGERNEFSSLRLDMIARECLARSGVKMNFGDNMSMIAAAFRPTMQHSTSDFVEILANVANKSMMRGYLEAEETFDVWTAKGSLSDFKANKRVDLNLFPSLAEVPEGAEYSYGTIGDRGETIQLATYGKMFGITRQAIVNDDMSAFTRIPQRMGRAAKRTVGNLVYAVLTDNAAMADGVTLFHADHDNVGTGAITTANVDAGRAIMAKQKDPDSHAAGGLNIRPAYLLVPVELEGKAQALMMSEFDPSQTQRNPNYVRGLATVVSEARLSTASSAVWYMAANPMMHDTIEVAYLNGNDQPTLEQRDGWNVDGVEFKVRLDAGVKALDYRGLYRSTGS